jgi:hypothetical protein
MRKRIKVTLIEKQKICKMGCCTEFDSRKFVTPGWKSNSMIPPDFIQ